MKNKVQSEEVKTECDNTREGELEWGKEEIFGRDVV